MNCLFAILFTASVYVFGWFLTILFNSACLLPILLAGMLCMMTYLYFVTDTHRKD
jgi:hypothetical protein